jgi:predicted nucleic acid-binding protein
MMLRYWDTNCFLGVLNKEPDKIGPCRAVLREAQGGAVQLVTSALTLTEVLWPKGVSVPLPKERAETIHKFFLHEWIVVYDLDQTLAERAREIVWDHGVKPKDSIHVATAIDAKVDQFDTFDGPLISLSGKLGHPPLVIGQPDVPETLFDQFEESEAEGLPDEDAPAETEIP